MPQYKDIQRLADREILGEQYQRALTNPDPTLGWQGDPDLVLAHNRLLDRWEIWREEAWFDVASETWQTGHLIIGSGPASGKLSIPGILKGLVERDTRVQDQSHARAMDQHFKDLDAETKRRDDEFFEKLAPVQEKLAWHMAKESGDLSPYVSLS